MEQRVDNPPHGVYPWLGRVSGWLRDIADLCLPPLCPACRAPVESASLCASCKGMIDTLAAAPSCDLCGQFLAYAHAPCPHCNNRGIRHYDRVVRLSGFETPVKSLIHQFKYHGRWIVGQLLADRLFQEDRVESLLLDADCLVPVPLHAVRFLSRGFNQAELIADRLSSITGIPVVCPATRIRPTDMQSHLHSPARRLANLKGAFRLHNPDAIAGQHVVVIDDVMTTGATLQTLARALCTARPASLSVLVIAVANARHGPAKAS